MSKDLSRAVLVAVLQQPLIIVKLELKAPNKKDRLKNPLPALEMDKPVSIKKSVPIIKQAEKQEQDNQLKNKVTKRKAIPQSVKRIVWSRDKGCCTQCGSRFRLEYDHIIPVSMGGDNNPRNIRLACRNCNSRAAIKVLGQRKMNSYINRQMDF